jgi:long-chain acyl-CoA synthetase
MARRVVGPTGARVRPGMNSLYLCFETAAARHAGAPAIEFRPRFRTQRWRYADLAARVHGGGADLAAAGVGAGDRVLLCADTSPHWVAAYFAVLQRGAIVVPLNPQSPPAQLERIAAAVEPKLALAGGRRAWPLGSVPHLRVDDAARARAAPAAAPGRDSRPQDVVEIVYTSGTVGDPKGVMLTNANLLANVAMVGRVVPLAPADHVLTIVPLHHMYGQMPGMLYPLQAGCTVTYLTAPSARMILEALAHTPVTHMVAVPEFLKTVMDRLEERIGPLPRIARRLAAPRLRARISKTLHTIVSGGAPLDAEVEAKWRALGYEILQGYGLTEASPVIASNTPRSHRAGSAGRPCEGVEIRIAADGEILVRGANVMAGYFRDEPRTRASFEDAWLRTGDGGHFDADGFLYVHGRRQYMILGPSGENVFPEDIEAELNRIPGVRDSAVFGLERHGRTVVHAVLLGDDVDGESAVAQANARLAPHQRIASWSLWPEADFPRSSTRKPRKTEIMARVTARAPAAPERGAATPLTRLLARVTGHDPEAIGPDTRIIGDLGVDSLLRIELVSCIEEELNAVIDETGITPETTVARLEAEIAHRRTQAPVLVRYPRWSLSPWASVLRPLARGALLSWWLPWLCRVRVAGAEHLEGLSGPVIFMANHRSFLDSPAILVALPPRFRRRLGIAAATEVLYGRYRTLAPLADLAFNSYPLPTAADENIKPGLEYTGRLLDDGWNVLIYPEGRMNRGDAPLQALKGGAGLLAVEMQVPVVPVAVLGSDRILPPDRIVPRRRGVVEVRFTEALRVGATTSHHDAARAIESALRAALAAASAD